jgi:hypothetical protein
LRRKITEEETKGLEKKMKITKIDSEKNYNSGSVVAFIEMNLMSYIVTLTYHSLIE